MSAIVSCVAGSFTVLTEPSTAAGAAVRAALLTVSAQPAPSTSVLAMIKPQVPRCQVMPSRLQLQCRFTARASARPGCGRVAHCRFRGGLPLLLLRRQLRLRARRSRGNQDELDAPVLLALLGRGVTRDGTEFSEAGCFQARAGNFSSFFEVADDVGGARCRELPIGREALARLWVHDAGAVGVAGNLNRVAFEPRQARRDLCEHFLP